MFTYVFYLFNFIIRVICSIKPMFSKFVPIFQSIKLFHYTNNLDFLYTKRLGFKIPSLCYFGINRF